MGPLNVCLPPVSDRESDIVPSRFQWSEGGRQIYRVEGKEQPWKCGSSAAPD
jgi:hypothetical protein